MAPVGVAIADWNDAASIKGNNTDNFCFLSRKIEDLNGILSRVTAYMISQIIIFCGPGEKPPLNKTGHRAMPHEAPFALALLQVFNPRRICEKFGASERQVTLSTSLRDDLEMDSLDVVELVMEIESEFGVTIPEERIEKITTIGEAIAIIESLAENER